MRTIILLGLLLLVSCGGGSVTPNPNPPDDGRILVTTMGVMDGGLDSTIRATISDDELAVVCDARSYKTIHFWATIMLYYGDGSVAGIIPIDYTGNYSETYYDISPATRGVWINDWGMRE
jgi:hypothetical protein